MVNRPDRHIRGRGDFELGFVFSFFNHVILNGESRRQRTLVAARERERDRPAHVAALRGDLDRETPAERRRETIARERQLEAAIRRLDAQPVGKLRPAAPRQFANENAAMAIGGRAKRERSFEAGLGVGRVIRREQRAFFILHREVKQRWRTEAAGDRREREAFVFFHRETKHIAVAGTADGSINRHRRAHGQRLGGRVVRFLFELNRQRFGAHGHERGGFARGETDGNGGNFAGNFRGGGLETQRVGSAAARARAATNGPRLKHRARRGGGRERGGDERKIADAHVIAPVRATEPRGVAHFENHRTGLRRAITQPAIANKSGRVIGVGEFGAARVEQAQRRIALREQTRGENFHRHAFARLQLELKIVRLARLGVALDGDGQLEHLRFRRGVVAARALDHRQIIDQKKARTGDTILRRHAHETHAQRRVGGHAEFAAEFFSVGHNGLAVLARRG